MMACGGRGHGGPHVSLVRGGELAKEDEATGKGSDIVAESIPAGDGGMKERAEARGDIDREPMSWAAD